MTNRKKRVGREKDEALGPREKFVGKLKGHEWLRLSMVASALHHATSERQLELVMRLRAGELTASVHWPIETSVLRLPSTLWRDVADEDFRVRTYVGETIKRGFFRVPLALLYKHCATPLHLHLKSLETEAPPMIDERLECILDLTEDEIRSLIKDNRAEHVQARATLLGAMLNPSSKNRNAGATAVDCRQFATKHLESGAQRDQRGRPRAAGADDLVLEIVRRLLPFIRTGQKLPNQNWFSGKMFQWWTENAGHAAQSESWVHQRVKSVWQMVKSK